MKRKAFSCARRIAALALLLVPEQARGAGTTAALLLKEPLGARPLAMASNYSSLADDAFALVYNPAGLGLVRRAHLASHYGAGLEEAKLTSLLYAQPLGGWGGIGAGLTRLDAGEIRVFSLDGSEAALKAQEDLLVTLGYGFVAVPDPEGLGRFGAGAAFKFYRSTLVEQAVATAAAWDLGALWETRWGPTVGVNIANLGPGVGYRGGLATGAKSPLPRTLRIGASSPIALFGAAQPPIASVEFTQTVDEPLAAGLGAEWKIAGPMVLRGGYKFGDEFGSFTAGLGWVFERLRVDYGFGLMSAASNQHFISLGVGFGASVERPTYAQVRSDYLDRIGRHPEALFEKREFFRAAATAKGKPWLPKAQETLRRIDSWVAEVLEQGHSRGLRDYWYARAYKTRFGGGSASQLVADLEQALLADRGNEEIEEELAGARQAAAALTTRHKRLAAKLYRRAINRHKQKRYDDAIALLRDVMQLDPGHEGALRLLDLAIQDSVRLRARPGAEPKLPPTPAQRPSLAQFDPQKALELYNQGLRAYLSKQYAKAIQLFQQALVHDPELERAHRALQRAHQDLR